MYHFLNNITSKLSCTFLGMARYFVYRKDFFTKCLNKIYVYTELGYYNILLFFYLCHVKM